MKRELTETSILLFEKKGFNQTSIQDIVDELQVTKGSFYYYFTSKEELLMGIHLDYITKLLNRQEKIIEDERITEKEKLNRVIRLLIKDVIDNGPSARVFFREFRHLRQENIDEIKKHRTTFRLNLEEVIKKGIDTGEFRNDLRPDILTFGILGVTNWSYNWFRSDGDVSIDELVDIYSKMILTGIEK